MLATNVTHLASLNNDWICIQTQRRVPSENPLLLPFKPLEIPSQSRSVWECSDLSFNYSVDKNLTPKTKTSTFTEAKSNLVAFQSREIIKKRIGKRGRKITRWLLCIKMIGNWWPIIKNWLKNFVKKILKHVQYWASETRLTTPKSVLCSIL